MSVVKTLYVQTGAYIPAVDGKSISTAQWTYLSNTNQNVATTSGVQFDTVKVTNGSFTTEFKTGATASYALTFPVDDGTTGQLLKTDGSGVLSWVDPGAAFDQSLNTTNNVQFVDLKVTGNLTVTGTTTTVGSTNLIVEDNMIQINNESVTHSGVTLGVTGVEIIRDQYTNTHIQFNETSNTWQVGVVADSLAAEVMYNITRLALSDAAVAGSIPVFGANGELTSTGGLSATEVDQLENINSTVISTTQWGYLGATDQGVTTTSDVTFNKVTLTTPLVQTVSAVLTADPAPLTAPVSRFSTAGGAIVCTLPTAASSAGKMFTIILTTAGNDLTITRASTDTIDNGTDTTLVLSVAHQRVTLMAVGTVWYII